MGGKRDWWIGVDLDGTLAEDHGWKGEEHIGKPVKPMMDRVKGWLDRGQRVKIFTARCHEPTHIPHIERWLNEHGIGGLEITNVKDQDMIQLWDDRCVRVEKNTGKVIGG